MCADIDITLPSLSGGSYLVFQLPSDISEVTNIDIALRPNASEGIIYYSSQMMNTVTQEGGISVLRYDLGSGTTEISSYSDFHIF